MERAYVEGYRFVLDADIEAFFDSVPWSRLFEKLAALFPLDPPLLDLLAGWVKAPVVFDGRTIDRAKLRRGLPQGAAISPLLANLYLDELDEELTREGFRRGPEPPHRPLPPRARHPLRPRLRPPVG